MDGERAKWGMLLLSLADGLSINNRPTSVDHPVIREMVSSIEEKVEDVETTSKQKFRKDDDYVLGGVNPSWDRRNHIMHNYGEEIAMLLSVYDKGRKLHVSPNEIRDAINYATSHFSKDQLHGLLTLIPYSKADSHRFVFAINTLQEIGVNDAYKALTNLLFKGSFLEMGHLTNYVKKVNNGTN